jgi:hypothetical protein
MYKYVYISTATTITISVQRLHIANTGMSSGLTACAMQLRCSTVLAVTMTKERELRLNKTKK